MAITRVREFAAKMLEEIDGFERESIAKIMIEIDGPAKDAASTNTSTGVGSVSKRDPNVLVHYESEVAVTTLRDMLQNCLSDETVVSEAALKPFADFLLTRFNLIKNTNCIYNHSPKSLASLSFIALAKKLYATLDPITKASGREVKYLHYYDYLFPDFPCSKFKSLQHGFLGDYELHQFFWTEDAVIKVKDKDILIPSRPLVVFACLEDHRLKVTFRPPHVYLTQEEMNELGSLQLTRNDTERLTAHSGCAKDYFMAISGKKPEAELNKFKLALDDLISRPDFVPGCTYPNSNLTIIKNGFLNSLNVSTLHDLADLLHVRVKPEDWRSFVEAIPSKPEDELYKMALPKLNNGEPDTSVLNPDKFENFVNQGAWYVDGPSRHNNAALLLLAELYRRKRSSEGVFTGAFSHLTSGLVSGHPRGAKQDAVDVLMDFFVTKKFCLNQIDEYLEKTGKIKTHGAAIKSDRLLFLVNKANSLWNKILADTKNPADAHVEDVILQEGHLEQTLVYNAETLHRDARKLCEINKADWKEEVKSISKVAFSGYVKSCDGLYSCIIKPANYIKGNEAHNRAVFYILTDYYLRSRGDGDENETWLGGLVGAPAKLAKLKAVEKVLLPFFSSDMPLNHLPEYMAQQGLSDLSTTIYDKSYYSKTKALAQTAEAVCTAQFFEPVVDNSITSSVWKMLGSK